MITKPKKINSPVSILCRANQFFLGGLRLLFHSDIPVLSHHLLMVTIEAYLKQIKPTPPIGGSFVIPPTPCQDHPHG
jgi:hypothetical protein